MNISSEKSRANLQRTLLTWYGEHARQLPWRTTRIPYRILVSEIMLQQTQASRVLEKYPAFLRQFPGIHALASAPQRAVILAWRGMGYNNRAIRLHRLARAVVARHRGRIPAEVAALKALPGVGLYTAHAVVSFAFGQQVPAVDVNARRVLSRICWVMRSTAHHQEEHRIWSAAWLLLPRRKAVEWNSALMDLGATICTARDPACAACPVAVFCASRATMRRTRFSGAKREPSRDGIPNRIYRGRIVEALRTATPRHRLRADILGRMIHPSFSRRHEPWLRVLLAGLQKDGLIRAHGNGSLRSVEVSLG